MHLKWFDVSINLYSNHFAGDDVVPFKYGEKSAQSLSSAGFRYITFKSYDAWVIFLLRWFPFEHTHTHINYI